MSAETSTTGTHTVFRSRSAIRRLLVTAAATSLLAACGGGGGGGGGGSTVVADTTPPVITLTGSDSISVEQGEGFTDPGATARDARDGTVSVTVSGTVDADTAGTYTLTYTARDAAGNSATATRTVVVADTTPPELKLNGEASPTVSYLSDFTDPGAVATDTVDGDVPVTSTGMVETTTAGLYTITYSAQDAAGNTATATRTVEVEPQQIRLDVSVFGGGKVEVADGTPLTCSPEGDICTGFFEVGSEVTLLTEAGRDWAFNRWTACDTVTETSCTLTMDSERLALLSFARTTPLVLRDNVVELDESQIGDIIDFDFEDNTLTFAAGASISELEVDDVIIAQDIENDVYFAKRITEIIALNGAPTLLEVRDASIDEIIAEGSVSVVANFEDGTAVFQKTAYSDVPAGKTASFSLPLGADGFAKLEGSTDVVLDVVIDIDVSLSEGVQAYRFASDVALDTELEVAGSIPSPVENEFGRTLYSIQLPPIVVGPLVFANEAEFGLKGKVDVQTGFVPKAKHTGRSVFGVQSLNGKRTNLRSSDQSFDVTFDEVESKGSVEAGVALELESKLYKVAGPTAEAFLFGGAEGRLRVNNGECPVALSLYGGLEGNVGGEVSFFGRELDYSVTLARLTKNLGDLFPCANDTTPPSIVGSVSLNTSPEDSVIRVGWSPSTDEFGVAYYEVWRQAPGERFRVVSQVSASGFADAYFDRNAQPGEQYCYYVIAVDSSGNRSSVPAANCIVAAARDIEPPSAPTGLTGMPQSSAAIDLMWNASTDNDAVQGYLVVNVTSEDPDEQYVIEGVQEPGGTAKRLNPETEYCYVVLAVDNSNNISEPSERVCVTTLPKSASEWTMFIGCRGLDFLLQENLEIDTSGETRVDFAAAGNDYDGTPLSYIMTGVVDPETVLFDAEINWAFANTSRQRQDVFSANLSSGDSGLVQMDQTKVTGCEADIQFVNTTASEEASKVSLAAPVMFDPESYTPYQPVLSTGAR